MNISTQEYKQMEKRASPNSPVLKNTVSAFWVGGLLCMTGELIFQLVSSAGLAEKQARLVVTVSLILAAVILTGFKVFDNIAKRAGAGTLVPISGFANSVAAPAVEFKTEGYILGLGAKMFIIAGPVIVYGTVASVIYGLVLWVTTLF